ncbi:MAG: xanthine dehydrogenase [Melioribacter sp.]|nr:xanthine dehydrogenase [Melioribacter sp.]
MRNVDSTRHVCGQSLFVDDIVSPQGTLYGYVFYSSIAHGKILSIDFEEALSVQGVKGIISAKDIPGENQIGGIVQDEDLFAEETVHFIGHPIALVIAETFLQAHDAAKKIKCVFEKLPAVFDPREAAKKGDLIIPPRIFELGNINKAWGKCDYIFEGTVENGGQEHLYLETQATFAFPAEGGGIKIISSTQGPTTVQRTAARVLDLPMHKIEVDVTRLGGGFGGKEDQATAWAIMAALAALKLNKPVKIILPRQEDIRITGKRHPYSSDFKIGLTKKGKILAYEVTYYQNAGAAADLSPAILDRTLFHCTNSYFIPNVKATALSCKTNLTPFTAFRGFGGPQGMFVIESAIYKAAKGLGLDPSEIQKINLLNEGNEFPYGQKTLNCNIGNCFAGVEDKYKPKEVFDRIRGFNSKNKLVKKGAAIMPVTFGISFTTTFLNQASALLHIYTDGSVSISSAAIEMGQGVNEKLRNIAANELSINIERIRIDSTNTSRVSNTSATAASKGTDLNGFAVIDACKILTERLKKIAADELKLNKISRIKLKDEIIYYKDTKTALTFTRLVNIAYQKRISLTAQAHHSTPDIYFNTKTNKGKPFAYHSYGVGLVEVTLDCLRGIYEVDSVKVVHDFGDTINRTIDLGQAEGGIVQGIGWMTMEELKWNSEGKLLTDALSTYKIPDIHAVPKEMKIHFLENASNPFGPNKSKAIGEPPLMYGIGVYFALMNAMKAFKPNLEINFSAPLTPEKVLLTLYNTPKHQEKG